MYHFCVEIIQQSLSDWTASLIFPRSSWQLHLCLSHLREHKFNHNFQDTINLLFLQLKSGSNSHFFLPCKILTDFRKFVVNEFIKIDSCIYTLNNFFFRKLLVYGGGGYASKRNTSIILASIKFIYSSERFDGQLMRWKKQNICLRCLNFSVCLIISTNQVMGSCLSLSVY